ncbi:class I SAM-dependent methyltransferase [Burkholderia sp. TSV86]|uniref:class I SAM-dependent methyltransferase n=1 Tax=Burkholderia sp. TSV86 TaxID=1385594 RepID=UPI00075AB4D3|nr:class I SAM-dependent methyltransferase [Burkholderia sp. TSV86]KVE35525.1 SAM-dependent methyltransferase [Burkholderia sp. TSV86]
MDKGLEQDRINQAAWRSSSSLRAYGNASGWTDPGEAAAFEWLAQRVDGGPILDVGVGGGRTVPLLKTLGDDYIAVDYTSELVDVCRRNHPDTRVYLMDARDLSAFADGSFSLVVFSYNGIDAVDHDGRVSVLNEFARVLKPGGLMWFSTHNLAGPSYREGPAQLIRWPRRSANPLVTAIDAARIVYTVPISTLNYWRNSRLNQEFDGYARRVCAAHKFGILVTYTDFATQRRQLDAAGFHLQAAFGSSTGRQLRDDQDLSGEAWFHFIASKRGT